MLSLGAASLDQKALTIKSLNTLGLMADGKATKIIFPFEITKLMEGASEFMGASRTVPDRPLTTIAELERSIGPAEKVLGHIPSPEEIQAQLREFDKEIEQESKDSLNLAQSMMGDDLELDTKMLGNLPDEKDL